MRQRRHRARRRRGLLVVPVEIHENHLDDLIRNGLLDQLQVGDPAITGEAVGRAFKAWLRDCKDSGCHGLRRSGRT